VILTAHGDEILREAVKFMFRRRDCLTVGLILAVGVGTGFGARRAWGQVAENAAAFVRQVGDRLVAVVNSNQSLPDKRSGIAQIVETTVDVNGIAQFCLGRFWRIATPDQQRRFVIQFHQVLVTNISSKLGDYRGVRVTVQRSRQQDDDAIVTTLVERPNNPPTTVDWVIEQPATNPKVVDVVAEGTSLRLTQRQDYSSYLTRNNNDVDALINAMKQQAAQNG
jgi:phospholipid transport system substrate-binding protein